MCNLLYQNASLTSPLTYYVRSLWLSPVKWKYTRVIKAQGHREERSTASLYQ